VSALDKRDGWSLLLRLDPAWLKGATGRLPRIAFRIYDDAPSGWFVWPLPRGTAPATTVERTPYLLVQRRLAPGTCLSPGFWR
jgi:hypothetical protein